MKEVKCPKCHREWKVKDDCVLTMCPCGEIIIFKKEGAEGGKEL